MTRHSCLVLTILFMSNAVPASELVIHRCVLADGSVAFQELPCVAPQPQEETPGEVEDPAPADDFFSFENPFDTPAAMPPQTKSANEDPPSNDRKSCEKSARLSIDLIDAKLNETRSEDDREIYLAELLELTAQLRACKQL